MDRVLEEVGEFCPWTSWPSFMAAEGEDTRSWGSHLKCSALREVSVCGRVCHVTGVLVFRALAAELLRKLYSPLLWKLLGYAQMTTLYVCLFCF